MLRKISLTNPQPRVNIMPQYDRGASELLPRNFMNIITVKNLVKKFKDFVVLYLICFSIVTIDSLLFETSDVGQ